MVAASKVMPAGSTSCSSISVLPSGRVTFTWYSTVSPKPAVVVSAKVFSSAKAAASMADLTKRTCLVRVGTVFLSLTSALPVVVSIVQRVPVVVEMK